MARLKRIGTIGLFLVFTIVGIALSAFGDEQERLLGAATALFFGGGGLGWTYMTRRRVTPLPGFRIGRIRHHGQEMSGLVVNHDRRTVLVSGLTCLALALGCALLLASGAGGVEEEGRRWAVGIGGVALFGGVGIFALIRADRGSQLVLSRLGLHAISPTGRIFVPWQVVGGVGETEVHGNRFLTVHVTDPGAMEMGRLQRLMHLAERSMGHDLSFAVRAITVEPGELATAIDRYRTDPDVRSAIGTRRELDIIRSMAPPPLSEEGVAISDGRRTRERLAIASLFGAGGLVALLMVVVSLDGPSAGGGTGRAIGIGATSVGAGLELLGAVLLMRRQRLGRWLAIAGTVTLLALFVLALAGADANQRVATAAVVGVLAFHAGFVVWALRARAPVA